MNCARFSCNSTSRSKLLAPCGIQVGIGIGIGLIGQGAGAGGAPPLALAGLLGFGIGTAACAFFWAVVF